MGKQTMINVTKTFLPDFDKYTQTIKRSWDKAWITNHGELVLELEQKLKEHLGVKHLFFTNNGTIVLQMALKAFDITKEVITTPFSYVATTNAILWEKCTPIFADINNSDFCIDPDKIEEKITENTQAILATHVFGYPCNIEKIASIAQKHNLKVIYDGAHAFNSLYNNRQLLQYGDISTCSFHATKLFHTVEGGCIITDNDEIAHKLMLLRQFGHVGDNYYSEGINGKNSEFHAGMGLCVLPELNNIISARKKISELYDLHLKPLSLQRPNSNQHLVYNYAYYPVVFDSEAALLKAKEKLQENGVNSRRYFYPSLNNLPYLTGQSCPVSESISSRVLCLPLFHDLAEEDVLRICFLLTHE
jgi:dTDP-4-amino-4,6-dideoxygalactose transaminase